MSPTLLQRPLKDRPYNSVVPLNHLCFLFLLFFFFFFGGGVSQATRHYLSQCRLRSLCHQMVSLGYNKLIVVSEGIFTAKWSQVCISFKDTFIFPQNNSVHKWLNHFFFLNNSVPEGLSHQAKYVLDPQLWAQLCHVGLGWALNLKPLGLFFNFKCFSL